MVDQFDLPPLALAPAGPPGPLPGIEAILGHPVQPEAMPPAAAAPARALPEPPADLRTPDRRRISKAGEEAIVGAHRSGAFKSERELAERWGVAPHVVQRVIATADAPPVPAHLLTPRRTHLSLEGRTQAREMRQANPRMPLPRIAGHFGVSLYHINTVMRSDGPAPAAKQESGIHLSKDKKRDLRAMLLQKRPRYEIADRLGVSLVTIRKHEQALRREAAQGRRQPTAGAQRQVMQMQDWEQVLADKSHIGDLFSVPTPHGRIDFQVVRERHANKPYDSRDFRPYVRGG